MIGPVDRPTVLASRVFLNLPDGESKEILRTGRTERYEKGQFLAFQGDPTENVLIPLKGWIKLSRISFDGDEAVLRMCSLGDMIGLPNMICGGEQTANVSAATNVRVFSIPAKFLAERMKVSDELSRNIMLALCLENSGLSLEVERMKCQTALQRLAEFLFQICPIDKGAAEFSLPYSKSLIASRLGVRPESFSRLLARLKKYGVKVTGDNIQVGEVKMLLALMSEDTSSQNHAQWA